MWVLLSSRLADGGGVTLLKANRQWGMLLSKRPTDGGGCFSPQGYQMVGFQLFFNFHACLSCFDDSVVDGIFFNI